MTGMGKGKRLTTDEWLEIRAKWESGYSISELAIEYDLHRSSIRDKRAREGWVRRPDQFNGALDEARKKVSTRLAENYAEVAEKTNKRHQTAIQYMQKLAVQMIKEIEANLEAVQFQREEKVRDQEREAKEAGVENFIPRPVYVPLGKVPYEADRAYAILKDAIMTERHILKLEEFDPRDADHQSSRDRLIDILVGYAPKDEDSDGEDEASKIEAFIHSDDSAGE